MNVNEISLVYTNSDLIEDDVASATSSLSVISLDEDQNTAAKADFHQDFIMGVKTNFLLSLDQSDEPKLSAWMN